MGFCGGRPFEIRSAHLEHITQVQSALQKQHFDTCPRALSQGKPSVGFSFLYLLTISTGSDDDLSYASYVSLISRDKPILGWVLASHWTGRHRLVLVLGATGSCLCTI